MALGKKCFQSSTFATGNPSKAVDGSTNTFYHSAGGCSHTHKERDPWWQVDLGAEYSVYDVMLTNRGDCCGESHNVSKVFCQFYEYKLTIPSFEIYESVIRFTV